MESVKRGETRPTPKRRVALTTTLLALAFSLSYMDRQILPLLLEPIKHAFSLTDSEIGMLQGLAFGAFYACSGIVLGVLVDKFHRVGIAAACVAFWGLATAACGLAGNFIQLFIARTSTAVGEAGCSPASYSILSDMLSGRALLRATAVYNVGPYVGGGMALILGSMALRHFTTAGGMDVPLIGHIEPWQSVFLVLGFPGILLAALILALKEPKRHESGQEIDTSTRATLQFIFSSPMLLFHFAAFVFSTSGLFVLLTWFPSLMIREGFGTAATIGRPLGAIFLAVGLCGCVASQLLLRKLENRDLLSSLLKRMSAMWAVQIPLAVAFIFVDKASLAYLFYASQVIIFSVVTTFMVAPIQLAVPNRMRGRATGVFMTFNYMLGASIGPWSVGVLSDRMKENPHSLLTAFVMVLGVSAAGAAVSIYLSSTRKTRMNPVDSLPQQSVSGNI
jgi:MFS family permease